MLAVGLPEALSTALESGVSGLELRTADGAAASARFDHHYDVAVVVVGAGGARAVARRCHEAAPTVPLVVVSDGVPEALDAWGAAEALELEGLRPAELARAIRYAAARGAWLVEREGLQSDLERLRVEARILESAGHAIVATDLQGRVTHWNPAAEALYGWTAREAVGRDIVDLVPTSTSREEAASVMEHLSRGESWRGMLEVERRDGRAFLALVRNSPLLDEDGVLIGVVGASDDITELEANVQTLQKRVRELRSLFCAVRAINEGSQSIETRMQRFVDAIPGGWLNPDATRARLVFDGKVVCTEGFEETTWMQSEDIRTPDGIRGHLTVTLLDPRPTMRGELILPEERELLGLLAAAAGEALARAALARLHDEVLSRIEEAVLVIAPGRRIEDANSAAERMFGYPRAALVGDTTEKLHVDRAAYERFDAEGASPLLTRGVFRTTSRMRRSDGSIFDSEHSVSLLHPEAGLSGGAVSVIRDVSSRARAERELRASEARFRQIAEHVPSVFWIRNVERAQLEYLSPAFRDVWGRDPETLLQRPESFVPCLHPDDRARVLRAIGKQLEGGYAEEYRIVRPSGEVRWVRDRAVVVHGEDGRPARIIGVAEDVTERRQAEERVHVLSENTTDAITVLSPEGRIQYASRSVRRVLGYTQAELEGTDVLAVIPDEERARVRGELERLRGRPGAVVRVEHRAIRKDGDVRTMESIAHNREDLSAAGGVVVSTRDITDRLALEMQLRQSQKMEAIGRLAGGVAHDFNNLLTAITGHAELMSSSLELDEESANDLASIQRAADRARGLTAQLLAFSRRELTAPRTFDLRDAVEEMGKLVRRLISEAIEIRIDLGPEPLFVHMDETQAGQVVMNLCVNASDAIAGAGTIDVGLRRSVMEEVVLEVRDDGAGMSPEVRARIFEPFYTTKELGRGTGLGLSTVWGAVHAAGGRIEVDSEEGVGSCFQVFLPLESSADVRAEQDEAEVRRSGEGRRVLLVEDDAPVREVLERMLRQSGYETICMQNGEAALRFLLERGEVDAVVSDVIMPDVGGIELLRRLRDLELEVPVLLMSGYPGEDIPEFESTADLPFGKLDKPFTRGQLLERLAAIIDAGAEASDP